MNENPLLPTSYDILWSAIILVFVVMAIWALATLAKSAIDAPTKLAWAVLVIVVPALGSVVWLAYQHTHAVESKR